MKRLTASLLCLTLLLTVPGTLAADPAASPEPTAAQTADILVFTGFLTGTESGLELDRALTRAEGAALLARAAGQAYDAAFSDVPQPFRDVPDWADRYVALLWSEGVLAGVSAESFGPDQPMGAPEFYAALLCLLGYDDSEDDLSDALAFSQKIGLLDAEEARLLGSGPFARSHAVLAVYRALNQPCRGTEQKLCDKAASGLNASYDKTVAAIVAGRSASYTVLSRARDAVAALESYTLSQTGTYAETHENGKADTARIQATALAGGGRVLISTSYESRDGSGADSGDAGLYDDGVALYQKPYQQDWLEIPDSAGHYTQLYSLLFGPTLDLCADLDVRTEGGEIIASGYGFYSNLLFDITGGGYTDYYYDLEMVFDAKTYLPKRVTVTYRDTWYDLDESGALTEQPLKVDYRVSYAFTDFNATDVDPSSDADLAGLIARRQPAAA